MCVHYAIWFTLFLLGYLVCYGVLCYIKAQPSSSPNSIFSWPIPRCSACLAKQNWPTTTRHEVLSRCTCVETPTTLCHWSVIWMYIRGRNDIISVSALSGHWRLFTAVGDGIILQQSTSGWCYQPSTVNKTNETIYCSICQTSACWFSHAIWPTSVLVLLQLKEGPADALTTVNSIAIVAGHPTTAEWQPPCCIWQHRVVPVRKPLGLLLLACFPIIYLLVLPLCLLPCVILHNILYLELTLEP